MSNNPFDELSARLERIEKLLMSPVVDPVKPVDRPLTTKELCVFLNVTEQTLVRWKKQRRIPFMQIGSCIRFDKAAVIRALEKPSKK